MIWILTFISIAGVILNIYKNRWGFFFWMISNAFWIIIDFRKGIPEQSVLFVVYFLTSVWGWIYWSNESGNRHPIQGQNGYLRGTEILQLKSLLKIKKLCLFCLCLSLLIGTACYFLKQTSAGETVFIVLIGFIFVFFYKVSKILCDLIEAIGDDRKQSYE